MKMIKMMILCAAVLSVGVISSCGGGDDDDPKSDKEVLLEDLQGTWTLDASNSQFANTDIDGSGISATFTETGYTLSGAALTAYASGGTYTVTDAGTITDVTVNIASDADITLDGDPTFSINSAHDTITITFTAKKSDGRVGGVGGWKLVFTKG